MAVKILKVYNTDEDIYEEIIGEVQEEVPEAWPENKELKIIGKRIPRINAPEIVTGEAKYAYDIIIPGMLVGKILRSPYPHANIKNIDTSKAEKLKGVKAVITYKNTSNVRIGRDPIFNTTVKYEGEEIAAVAAVDENTALDALDLIKVEYEELPFVVDPEEAMKPNAPKIHPQGNIVRGRPSVYSRGNIEKGFNEADIVIEETFRTPVVHHSQAEVHISVAKWEEDYLTVWDTTQGVFRIQSSLANIFHLPVNKVRVICHYMGGAFGCKLSIRRHTVYAVLLAKITGRPVKIALSRKDDYLAGGNRPSSIQQIKAGIKKDGTLTALYQKTVGAVGAYPGSAGVTTPLRTLYKCPNVKTEEYSVYVNAGQSCAHRAPGHVQGTFALDQMIDILAEKTGIDPLELRKKNYIDRDQQSNLPYTSKYLLEAYDAGAKEIGWERRNKIPGSGQGRYKRGIGMATQIWWGGGRPPAFVNVKINSDGTVNVLSGAQDIGTGTTTIVAQCVAEELGIKLKDVKVTIGDSEVCPYGPTSGGSVTAPSMCPAARAAARDAKNKLLEVASVILKSNGKPLDIKDGRIFLKNNPEKSITIKDVIGRSRVGMILGSGAREDNPEGYAVNTFGAHFAEVEVDTWTGKIKIVKYVAAHDIGRVINMLTAVNQIQGGIIQGLGFTLSEERIINKNVGRMENPDMCNYLLPLAGDTPEIVSIIVSKPDNLLSHTGNKGLGEPPMIPVLATIANAFYNATGVRIKVLPMTPEKVLMALKKI
ncbi:xanthine dehydrogenase family protein molybdopterin-binding subunit [candidate division KSB1 bacterium]|nr:MAG: xanthine dehydrogenase family protein molybdopterin-binding subunit [candidate division KSB1 bacterium]